MVSLHKTRDVEDEEERLIMQGGAGILIGPVSYSGSGLREDDSTVFFQDGVPRPLLPPVSPKHAGRKCLVLDLDETLVHSSFKVCVESIPFCFEVRALGLQHRACKFLLCSEECSPPASPRALL